MEPDKTHWEVTYLRKVIGVGKMSPFTFKDPDVPDIFATPVSNIVKVLKKPKIVEGKLLFNEKFEGLIMR